MRISVAIPAYNCADTIRQTLNSVLSQSVQAAEILVVDDGSTDETPSILDSYKPHISVLTQSNQGVASARNLLCARALGDVVAFLDSDDIWHSRYLETQRSTIEQHPNAVAYFTGHINFTGFSDYEWTSDPFEQHATLEVIPSLEFLRRYNLAPGPFMCVSHCCVPKRVFAALGNEPFKLRMAEDLYFFNLAVPTGPVVFLPKPMVAYRVREGSLSSDRLKLTQAEVQAFELLAGHYASFTDSDLKRSSRHSFAAKRRLHAKVLLGVGQTGTAREQLRLSLRNRDPLSLAKSICLFLLSYLPPALQPKWPSSHREWKTPQGR